MLNIRALQVHRGELIDKNEEQQYFVNGRVCFLCIILSVINFLRSYKQTTPDNQISENRKLLRILHTYFRNTKYGNNLSLYRESSHF